MAFTGNMMRVPPVLSLLLLWIGLLLYSPVGSFSLLASPPQRPRQPFLDGRRKSERGVPFVRLLAKDDDLPDFELPEEQADRMKRQAEILRQQIRDMEQTLSASRELRQVARPTVEPVDNDDDTDDGMSLRNRRVLVVGANGRLGSMVCRYLLRNHAEIGEVVAAVHVVSENSPTARGYGRLSYEVGAEDGIGSIGSAWSSAEERVATFSYDEATMSGYNLHKLRVVECELLDPVACQTVCEGVDALIWCATDFNGNTPRAVSGLNIAFLFRALASPLKGRVEIEGLQNMLSALSLARQEKRRQGKVRGNDPVNVVLVSMVPEAFGDFETPFGEFNGLKRQAEQMLSRDYPSLTSTVLQMGLYDDNFVPEGAEVVTLVNEPTFDGTKRRRLINRRDAAKAAVDALINPAVVGATVQVYTATR
jgi:hypothetical protein